MYNCAIYTRVSTEEQAENPEGSIRNQELRLREFVKLKSMVGSFGEVAAVFSDPGVSAKDMNRPGFQKMLRAVEKREINLILVTELSRFTRSMKDFSLLQEFMKKHNCEFLSLRENFDSSSATGSLVMSIMATLAEFERKQTGERIANSFHERAKRGLYNGGQVPLGYRVDETKPGNLLIVPEEADLVRLVFQTFLKEETLGATAKALNRDGTPLPRSVRAGGGNRGEIWRMNLLWGVLKQQGYAGIRTYKDKRGNVLETAAVWEPIIEKDVFKRAQLVLSRNRSRKRTHAGLRYPYTLSGSIFCRSCGYRLSGKSAHGRTGKVAYYEHAYLLKQQENQTTRVTACEGHHRIQGKLIEPLVWNDVKDFLSNEAFVADLLNKAKAAKPTRTAKSQRVVLKTALAKAEGQIEALAERIGTLPKGIDPKALFLQLEKLQSNRDNIAQKLEHTSTETEATDEYIGLDSLKSFTEGFRMKLEEGDKNPEIQASIIRKIVERIEVLPDGYEIFYHAGLNHYVAELGVQTPGSALFSAHKQKKPRRTVRLGSFPSTSEKSFSGSTLVLNGGRCRGRTCDIHLVRVALCQLS